MHWHFADIQLKRDFVRAVLATQCECCSQRGMAGERQFFLYRKDTHANPLLAFNRGIAGQDEGGLREIHFLGERLHLTVSQSPAVKEYSQRVAFKWSPEKNPPSPHSPPPQFLPHEFSPSP